LIENFNDERRQKIAGSSVNASVEAKRTARIAFIDITRRRKEKARRTRCCWNRQS
jgi:hypothetical protein